MVPPPSSRVTDTAGFLFPGVRKAIDDKLSRYQARTGHEVLVWIGGSTKGEPIEAFATRMFNAWGIGRKGINDGAVIFVFPDDHQVRIELGLGLEERISHDTVLHIIQQVMVPRLKAGDHDGAINQGVNATLRTIDGAPWDEIAAEFRTTAPGAENLREGH